MCGSSRLGVRDELPALLSGAVLLTLAVAAASRYGVPAALGTIVAISLLVGTVLCFLWAPHVAVAAAIPLFAFIPALKVLVSTQFGPVKDAVTLCAGLAAAIHVVSREGRGTLERSDRIVLGALAGVFALYVANTGGMYSEAWHGTGWIQGVRLAFEPLLLLAAGLLLPRPRRTVDWAAASLVGTACIIASFGIVQQIVGPAYLARYGYSYDEQLRTIGQHLRSFGTLDDPFTYAALLLLALSTTIFWARKGPLLRASAVLIALGIVFSFVQTAGVIAVALLALWFVRIGRGAVGALVLAAAVAAGIALAFATSPATKTETVQAGPSTYLTLNGRTGVWSSVFSDKRRLPLGLGVGEVGRASERARIGISDISGSPTEVGKSKVAVDSGYFATVADVGLVGLALLLLLLGRLATLLGGAALRLNDDAAWLGLAYLTVLVLDAATRDSFTAFPNAYLGFLLVGVTLAASRDRGSKAH